MSWQRYVALGDSFTEGLDDPYPDGAFRGWADLVAVHLAEQEPGLLYANLAIRGRLFDRVVADQLEPALAMRPDLVSFAAGGNDVLRRRCDPPALMARFDQVVGKLRETGAQVVLFRFADLTSRLPGGHLVGPRVRYLNQAVGEVAQRHGALLVDLWGDDEYGNPALWSVDRLHLSSAGHLRTAAHVLRTLRVEPPPQWWATPDTVPARSWAAERAADFAWAYSHLVPWVRRRLTGRSSGDGLLPKRPELLPVHG